MSELLEKVLLPINALRALLSLLFVSRLMVLAYGANPSDQSVEAKAKNPCVEALLDHRNPEFRIGGVNSTETIRRLKSINNMPIEEIEARMRPGWTSTTGNYEGSDSGFLGFNERLTDVLADDNDAVLRHSLTHQIVASKLRTLLSEIGKIEKGSQCEWNGNRYQKVEQKDYLSVQTSPFLDGTSGSSDYRITNLATQQTLFISNLMPLMIERYGFYQGNGSGTDVVEQSIATMSKFSPMARTPEGQAQLRREGADGTPSYRLDPEALIRFLGLAP